MVKNIQAKIQTDFWGVADTAGADITKVTINASIVGVANIADNAIAAANVVAAIAAADNAATNVAANGAVVVTDDAAGANAAAGIFAVTAGAVVVVCKFSQDL